MRNAVALGVDVGTTRIKAATVSLDGRELHSASTETPWRPSDQGPLLDLDQLRDDVIALCDEAASQTLLDGDQVSAIAITGMAETGALLDGAGRPIVPGFAWHHRSGDPERIFAALGEQEFIEHTGRTASITPSITKLDLLRHQGHTFAPGQRWLTIPDYVSYCLCGEQAAELSEASRTGLLDIVARTWWDDALEFLGATRSLLPGEPVPTGTVLGPVRGDLPGSLRGAVVATGGHDHPMAAIGVGVTEPGVLGLSLGTAEAQLRIIPPITTRHDVAVAVAASGFVDWHPLGDRMTLVGAIPTGITLERLATLLGCRTLADRLALSVEAMRADLPATGVRLAEADFDRFSLTDIGDDAQPAAVWRAVVSALSATSGSVIDAVEQAFGPRTRAVVYGGWIHDPLVRRERLNQLGPNVAFSDIEEAGIVGSALVAAKAAGLIDSLPTISQPQGGSDQHHSSDSSSLDAGRQH